MFTPKKNRMSRHLDAKPMLQIGDRASSFFWFQRITNKHERPAAEGRTMTANGNEIKPFYRLADFARITGVTPRTIATMRRDGRLPPPDARIGRCLLWKSETAESWINSLGKDAV
jgi:hypothetical protein